MRLSIIIPVYDEERTVFELVKKVISVKLPKAITIKELVVVNDGSKDSSDQEIERAIKKYKKQEIVYIKHKINRGKGAAVVSGINKSKGNIVLIQDADLEYDPRDYSRLLAPILSGKAEVVYGSRLMKYPLELTGRKKTPFVSHYLGNKFLTMVTNILYGNGVTDMETCYKVFMKSALKGIEINAKRFDLEPEITAKILKKGIKIHEVPIKVKPRGYGEGKKISWRDGFAALWTLLKYRFVD